MSKEIDFVNFTHLERLPEYGLVRDVNDGSLFFEKTPANAEEDALQAQQWERYVRDNGDPFKEEDALFSSEAMLAGPLSFLDDEEDNQDAVEEEEGTGRRVVRCSYPGCYGPLNETHACPNPNDPKQDLPNLSFCSPKCVVGYAFYEIGDPWADPIQKIVSEREGRHIDPPEVPPVDTISMDFGGMAIKDDTHALTEREVEDMGEEDAEIEEKRRRGKGRRVRFIEGDDGDQEMRDAP